ncbi:UNVERIFIED_CONTAM: hypothetical protein FKN15_005780 [Acipenser sinensis]
MSNHRQDSKRIDVSRNDAFRAFSPSSLSNRAVNELQDQLTVLKRQLEEREELILALTTGRKYINEWDDTKQQASRSERIYKEFVVQLANRIDVECTGRDDPQDSIVSQLDKLYNENTRQRCRIASLEETVASHEVESKASRETVMRLVSEVGWEQKAAASCTKEVESLRQEFRNTVLAKRSLEQENRALQERLEASRRAWEASKHELDSLEKWSKELDGSLRSNLCEAKSSQSLLQTFREELAALLSGRSGIVHPTEEAIKERIQEICSSRDNQKESLYQMEVKVSRLTDQLERQTELHDATLLRARQTEQQLGEIRERLSGVEGELISGDVLRDGMSHEKQNVGALYLRFLDGLSEKMKLDRVVGHLGFDMRLDAIQSRAEQLVKLEGNAVVESKTLAHSLNRKIKTLEQYKTIEEMNKSLDKVEREYLRFLDGLSEKMKLDRVVGHLGFDMRLDAIQSRAEQLVKLEGNAVVESKTLAHSLNRKLKTQKEQLESKELHMELLRKKIAQLEEEKRSRTALAVERDEANLTVRKLQKKVERLQKELGATRLFSTDLKSKLSDTNKLKIKTLEQYKTIEEMNKSLDKVERAKVKMEKRLTSVKSVLDFTEHEAQGERHRTHSLLEAVTSELATLKHTMGELAKRERQPYNRAIPIAPRGASAEQNNFYMFSDPQERYLRPSSILGKRRAHRSLSILI